MASDESAVEIESGRKVPDKFEKTGFHATKSEFVDAPLIDELPLAMECRVKSFDITSDIPFSHNAGYCTFLCPE